MGQFRPSSLIPSTLTSTYSVDATKDNVFSCRINGTSPTIKYQLIIMKNDINSTQIYDSGIVTLDTPLFPVNFDGTVNSLEVTVPSTSGMENGNEYKWSITSYWSETDSFTSFDNVFKAYSDATISISNFQEVINNKSFEFIASMEQAQGVGVEKFGWILRDYTTKREIINTIDSNNIYSSNIRLLYDGFLNNSTQEIKVKCWLLNGTEVETEFQEFSVSYDVLEFDSVVSVEQMKDSGMLVTWSNIYYAVGEPDNDDYIFVDGDNIIPRKFLELYAGNKIVFNQITGKQMDISTSSSHIIGFSCENNNSSIYRAEGVDSNELPYYIEVSISDNILYLDVNGNKNQIYNIVNLIDKWIILEINPSSIKIISYYDLVQGLYPSLSLYPSISLYPKSTNYGSGIREVTFNPNIILDGKFNQVSISGYQKTLFTWIRSQQLTNEQFLNFYDVNYIPSWDEYTLLLATYQGNFNAGNTYASSNIVGWLVYRMESDYPALKFVHLNNPEQTYIVDYMAKNNLPIRYYVFPSFENEIGLPVISEEFIPKWWDWYLIVCDKVSDDSYTMKSFHKFDLDVVTSSMSNNTTFNVLENFTKYAKIQNSKSNYWSGTINALLGNCGNTYVDTVKEMNEFKELTTDGLDKFLKDRKGNVWKVRLNSASGEQFNDQYIEQAVSISLSWMEVGSAELSKVIQNTELLSELKNKTI